MTQGSGGSVGLPMPRSITSIPARRLRSFSSLILPNKYGGRARTRGATSNCKSGGPTASRLVVGSIIAAKVLEQVPRRCQADRTCHASRGGGTDQFAAGQEPFDLPLLL